MAGERTGGQILIASLLAQGVDSLGRARGASFAAYQKGVVSLIEVLQSDENLLRASDARAQAQTESARAAVTAFKALGGGWQPDSAEAAQHERVAAAQRASL